MCDEIYDFGNILKKLRKNRNLSQETVAKKLGVNKATVSAYERNINAPTIDTLVTLSILYNASVDYILGLENRTAFYIDDLTPNQQEFVLDMLKQVRERFQDK